MKTVEIMGDFVKEAISDSLKMKSLIERGARKMVAVGLHKKAIPNDFSGSITTQSMNMANENLKPFLKSVGVRGPAPNIKFNDPVLNYTHPYDEIAQRAKEINPLALQNLPFMKQAQKKGFPDKYEAHKETIKNALPHLRAAKVNKTASLAVPSLENLGLGILAAPSAAHLMGHEMNEDNKSKMELAGLGVLAAHPTYELASAAVPGIKSIGQNIANGFNKVRPMLKLGHAAFYGNILKMI